MTATHVMFSSQGDSKGGIQTLQFF